MKTKNLVIYGVVLLVIVGIIVVANLLNNLQPSAGKAKFLGGIDEKKISAFNISTVSQGSVRVFRKGDVWMAVKLVSPVLDDSAANAAKAAGTAGNALTDTSTKESSASSGGVNALQAGQTKGWQTTGREFPADSASVASALEKLTSMRKDILVSENPGKQELFEVTAKQGETIEVFDDAGKRIANFILGKNASDWSSHYVRMVGSDKVYSVAGSVKYSLFSEFDRWRDKSIMRFSEASVSMLTLAKEGTSFDVEKSTDSSGAVIWKSKLYDSTARADDVNKIIKTLSDLKCAAFEEDSAAGAPGLGLDKPQLVATVTLTNGDKKVLMVGKQNTSAGSSRFWVKTSDRNDVYLLENFVVQELDKKPSDIGLTAAAPAVAAPPAKNSGK
jgi:hypothetical protein